MFNFLSKKHKQMQEENNQNQELFSMFSEKELEMEIPQSHLCSAETIGLFNYQGKELAYAKTDYIIFNDSINPTHVIFLTKRTANDFDPPVELKKSNYSPVFSRYSLTSSDGKQYYFGDSPIARQSRTDTISLKDLIIKNYQKNKKNMETSIKKYISQTEQKNNQKLVDELFAQQKD